MSLRQAVRLISKKDTHLDLVLCLKGVSTKNVA